MTYSIIDPPFALKLRETSRRDLQEYRKWFQMALPDRLGELTQEIITTPGFEAWEPNLTPESLSSLDVWFAHQVKTRPRTEHEIKEIKSKSHFEFDVADQELTTRTFSLAMDIGMYLGEVIRHNVTNTHWEQLTRNKKLADYGQMLIVGSNPVPLNPVRVLVSLAYGYAKKHYDAGAGRLLELYGTWSKLLGEGR